MYEIFADLHVHIGRSESGKPIKITAARSLNFANIAKECADRKGINVVGIIDCASPYVIENIEIARKPLYTTKANLERSGMGFTIMESFMDEVHIESVLGIGTKVVMKKIIKKDEEAEQEGVEITNMGGR